MAKTQLKKAKITVLGGADQGKEILVLFNPSEYSLERANAFKAAAVPGLGAPLLQFVNGEADQLSMELFLDDLTDPEGPTTLRQKEKDPVGKPGSGRRGAMRSLPLFPMSRQPGRGGETAPVGRDAVLDCARRPSGRCALRSRSSG